MCTLVVPIIKSRDSVFVYTFFNIRVACDQTTVSVDLVISAVICLFSHLISVRFEILRSKERNVHIISEVLEYWKFLPPNRYFRYLILQLFTWRKSEHWASWFRIRNSLEYETLQGRSRNTGQRSYCVPCSSSHLLRCLSTVNI